MHKKFLPRPDETPIDLALTTNIRDMSEGDFVDAWREALRRGISESESRTFRLEAERRSRLSRLPDPDAPSPTKVAMLVEYEVSSNV